MSSSSVIQGRGLREGGCEEEGGDQQRNKMSSQNSSVLIVALAAAAIVAPTSGLPSAVGSLPAPRSMGAAAVFAQANERGCGGGMRLRGGGFFFVPKPVWPLYDEEEIPP